MHNGICIQLLCFISFLNIVISLQSIYSMEKFDWRDSMSEEEMIPRYKGHRHLKHREEESEFEASHSEQRHSHHHHHSHDRSLHPLRTRRDDPKRLCGRNLILKLEKMCGGCTKPRVGANGESGASGLAYVCCQRGQCSESLLKQHCADDCLKN